MLLPFPSASDMESVQGSIQRAAARLEAAANGAPRRRGAGSCRRCVRSVPQRRYRPSAPSATEGKEKCHDFAHYLRLINYRFVTGGTGPLDELAINGQKEVDKALSIDAGTRGWFLPHPFPWLRPSRHERSGPDRLQPAAGLRDQLPGLII